MQLDQLSVVVGSSGRRRGLQQTANAMPAGGASITEVPWDQIVIGVSTKGPTDVGFERSSVRPDHIPWDIVLGFDTSG